MGFTLNLVKGVENQNGTGSIVHGAVQFIEHAEDDSVYSMEETVQELAKF